jgi:hypothetical protein
VSGVDSADFQVQSTGSATGHISGVTQIDGHTYRVVVDGAGGNGELGLHLAAAASGITDAAGNALSADASSQDYRLVPTPSIAPPAAAPAAPPPAPLVLAAPPAAPIRTFNPGISISASDTPTLAASSPAPLATPSDFDAGGTHVDVFTPTQSPAAVFSGPEHAAAATPAFIGVAGPGTALQALPEIGDFTAHAGEPVHIGLPADTFVHGEKSTVLSVEARLSDGRPLPPWLKFDPATGTLSGKPPPGLSQRLDVEIVARDAKGHAVRSHVRIDVKPTSPARHHGVLEPQLRSARPALAAQFAQHGASARAAEREALLTHLHAKRA